MADGNNRSRKRLIRHTACFSEIENALLMTRIELAGTSISAYLKAAALDMPLPRAARRPTTHHEDVARLLAQLGDLACAFRAAACHPAGGVDDTAIEAALSDLAELRLLCFKALGRQP